MPDVDTSNKSSSFRLVRDPANPATVGICTISCSVSSNMATTTDASLQSMQVQYLGLHILKMGLDLETGFCCKFGLHRSFVASQVLHNQGGNLSHHDTLIA